ncbi:unnamed protein product [Protopolystoma xenopodis]|uniref:Uncharacterized protein n=1 Tax=Protopolystoma xenopodis TaxID=117903 RepID=A0A3S4ZWL8_9PLAT|nr:unnamed protein product [Protopolystoma xenopodis]
MAELKLGDEDSLNATIVVLGDARVGKTAIIHRLVCWQSETLEGRYQPTVEDSYTRDYIVHQYRCRIRIMDTSGSYDFPAMQRLWIRRASAFLLVASRDRQQSLDNLISLREQICEERPDEHDRLPIVLAVNKHDLHIDQWVLTDAEIEAGVRRLGLPGANMEAVVSTSALVNEGISQLLQVLWEQNELFQMRHIHFPSIATPPTSYIGFTSSYLASAVSCAGANSLGDLRSRRFSAFAAIDKPNHPSLSSNIGSCQTYYDGGQTRKKGGSSNILGVACEEGHAGRLNLDLDTNEVTGKRIHRSSVTGTSTGRSSNASSGNGSGNNPSSRKLSLVMASKSLFKNRFLSQRRSHTSELKRECRPNPEKPIVMDCTIS